MPSSQRRLPCKNRSILRRRVKRPGWPTRSEYAGGVLRFGFASAMLRAESAALSVRPSGNLILVINLLLTVGSAGVAQLVEQLIRNQQVTRSSRVAGSKTLGKMTIRP